MAETIKSGGNMIYFSAIHCKKIHSFSEQSEAHANVIENAEISNTVFLVGHLTCEPHQWFNQDMPCTKFQIAVNRKYCAKGLYEIHERTDYPWCYTTSENAIRDCQKNQL